MRGLVALLLTTILAICLMGASSPDKLPPAQKDPKSGKIVVEFWHGMSKDQLKTLNSLIDDFNTKSTKYLVKGVYQGSYQTLSQKLIASLYAGRGPAASQMYESWATRFIKYGYLRPVEDFIKDDGGFTDKDRDDLVDAFRADSTYDIPGRGKVLATLPFNKSVYVLFVNQTMLESLGWDHPPRTWTELKELSKLMTKKDSSGQVTRYGFATRNQIEAFTIFLMSTGKNYMDDAGEFSFDGPEGRASLKFLVDLAKGEDKCGYVESDYLNTPFGTQKIGMYFGSTASFSFNDTAVGNKFIWRAYAIPEKEVGKGRVLCQGTNVGIYSTAPLEAQQGAYEFLKYLVSVEATSKWAMETGYMPVRKSAAEYGPMKAHLAKNPNFSNAFASLSRGMFEPKTIYWDTVRDAFQREIDAVLRPTAARKPDVAIDKVLKKCQALAATNRDPSAVVAEAPAAN